MSKSWEVPMTPCKRPFHALITVLVCMLAIASQAVAPQATRAEATTDAPTAVAAADYQPSPENLAARQRFRDARFGIFIHWGVYSTLGRGEWVMEHEKMTVDQYEKLPSKFNPTQYNPKEWVDLFKRAGAKYVTITSKHHDGFAMWDSSVSDWDIVDRTPYKRDVLKPLADQCRKQGLDLFFYHSHLDWHHPDYFPLGRTGHHSGRSESGDFNKYLDYMDAQLEELLSGQYGQIAGIWFDGWWDQRIEKPGADPQSSKIDWRLPRTYALIHRLQPKALIGSNHHVLPFAGEDFQMFERDLPGENKAGLSGGAKIAQMPLETCDTINGAWGYNAKDEKFKSTNDLVKMLVKAAGRDANLLLNVGPRPDGTIQPECVERLESIGRWLNQYGETIYKTRGGPVAPQKWGVSTNRDNTIYLHVLDTSSRDENGWITLSGTAELQPPATISRFADQQVIRWQRNADGLLQVLLPDDSKSHVSKSYVENVLDDVLVVRLDKSSH